MFMHIDVEFKRVTFLCSWSQ